MQRQRQRQQPANAKEKWPQQTYYTYVVVYSCGVPAMFVCEWWFYRGIRWWCCAHAHANRAQFHVLRYSQTFETAHTHSHICVMKVDHGIWTMFVHILFCFVRSMPMYVRVCRSCPHIYASYMLGIDNFKSHFICEKYLENINHNYLLYCTCIVIVFITNTIYIIYNSTVGFCLK